MEFSLEPPLEQAQNLGIASASPPMELSDDAPKFPKLPFLLGDAALIGVAIYVAAASDTPLPAAAIYTIAGCVAFGALLAVLPFIVDYNRRQEALLTERQGALEALARTTSSAVEQASIAANGLHQIVELAQKNLRVADQLPQKLHERINEFSRAQDEALAAELESLQQEVNTLRASEAEKLEAAADKIQRATTEFTKFEMALRQQVHALQAATQRAEKTIVSATAGALAELDKKLTAARTAPAATPAPAPEPGSEHLHRPSTRRITVHPETESAPPNDPLPTRPTEAPGAATASSHEKPVSSSTPAALAEVVAPATPPPALTPDPTTPTSATPARKPAAKRRASEHESLLPGLADDSVPPRHAESGHHKTSPSPAAIDDTAQVPPEKNSPEPALSSDGVTRLIVTAYIGIGNRLFVRGDAPGLSWDRGVPLQFVSIGKWRWETADAHLPVVVKLYKNDEVECTAVGQVRLKPGHQREVTATF